VFLEDDLDTLFPKDTCLRLIAHPTRISCDTSATSTSATAKATAAAAAIVPAKRLGQCTLPPNATAETVRIVIAVGPEGKIHVICYIAILID
jgi:hypothetical protein